MLLAAEKDANFALVREDVTKLTPYAVEARYPEFEEPLPEDAREMVHVARRIRGFVLGRLPDTLIDKR